MTRPSSRRSPLAGNGGNGSHWLPRHRRRKLYWRDAFACVWCGVACTHRTITLDHLVSRHLGGGNESENLVVACLKCNAARAHRSPVEWIMAMAAKKPLPLRAAVAAAEHVWWRARQKAKSNGRQAQPDPERVREAILGLRRR